MHLNMPQNLYNSDSSHIPTENAHARIKIPTDVKTIGNESMARRKRGRPLGSKDSKPRKTKGPDGLENEVNTVPPTGKSR